MLAIFAYDDLGRRTSLTRGNGTVTSYAFDAVSRLSELTQNLNGSTNDVTFGYSYNPAGEIVTNTRSNDAYSFTGLANGNVASTPNGLNQLTALGGTSIGHDARGNVSAIGGSGYSYDSANRMTGAAGASGYIYYEPLGRLSFIYDPAGTTARQYAGAQLVGEYISGVAQRRFVPGPGLDEPLVWYEGAGLSDRRWLHADERGSVIAASDGSGNLVGSINRYDDYGSPQGGAITGRFGYTGQVWMPGLNLYDYRARVYNPALGGRFMQSDPIGYEGGMNLYAYVGNNPVNFTDPFGLQEQEVVVIGTPLPQNAPSTNFRIPIGGIVGIITSRLLQQQEPDFEHRRPGCDEPGAEDEENCIVVRAASQQTWPEESPEMEELRRRHSLEGQLRSLERGASDMYHYLRNCVSGLRSVNVPRAVREGADHILQGLATGTLRGSLTSLRNALKGGAGGIVTGWAEGAVMSAVRQACEAGNPSE